MKNNLLPNLSLSLIMTDFELALRDALSSSLGVEGTRILGCQFHVIFRSVYLLLISTLSLLHKPI